MKPYSIERKAGLNRGKRRVWLEGADLVAAGFGEGARFDVAFDAGSIVLTVNPTGARKVSGKHRPAGFHPVIDIVGEKVDAALMGAERMRVTFADGRITVRPVEANDGR